MAAIPRCLEHRFNNVAGSTLVSQTRNIQQDRIVKIANLCHSFSYVGNVQLLVGMLEHVWSGNEVKDAPVRGTCLLQRSDVCGRGSGAGRVRRKTQLRCTSRFSHNNGFFQFASKFEINITRCSNLKLNTTQMIKHMNTYTTDFLENRCRNN